MFMCFLFFKIFLTSRRVKAAGDVNSCHTSATKCEEEFKKLTEQKSAQDLYLDKLSQDMEDLEQKCLDYEAQVIIDPYNETNLIRMCGNEKV